MELWSIDLLMETRDEECNFDENANGSWHIRTSFTTPDSPKEGGEAEVQLRPNHLHMHQMCQTHE